MFLDQRERKRSVGKERVTRSCFQYVKHKEEIGRAAKTEKYEEKKEEEEEEEGEINRREKKVSRKESEIIQQKREKGK